MADQAACWFKRDDAPATEWEQGSIYAFRDQGPFGQSVLIGAKLDGVMFVVPFARVNVATENPDELKAKLDEAKAKKEAAELKEREKHEEKEAKAHAAAVAAEEQRATAAVKHSKAH